MNDVESLDKMTKDLTNLAAKIEVHNNSAANHLRAAVQDIRQAIEGLSGSYSPPSPDAN